MIYEYYDPHPHICRMKQYECCTNYHKTCPLYHICKDMNKEQLISVCKRDCVSCEYAGCTMSLEKRRKEPLYINGSITERQIEIPIEEIKYKEKQKHIKNHKRLRREYCLLWDDTYKQHEKEINAKSRAKHRESINFKQRKKYQDTRAVKPENKKRKPNPAFFPECGYNCFSCTKPDCDVPDNYYRQQYMLEYREKNKEKLTVQKKHYRDEHRVELNQKSKQYYYEHHAEKLAYGEAYRDAHKEERKLYDKTRRERDAEKIAAYKKEYAATHKEQIRAYQREWARKNRAKKKAEFATN